jgi:hypothetical protein
MPGGIVRLREENNTLRRVHNQLLKLLKGKPADNSAG